MKITKKQLKEVCKIGQGEECCRYLTCGSKGFECAKNTPLQITLDDRVLKDQMNAQGDNCDGMDNEEEEV
jgi:hypothetical protein